MTVRSQDTTYTVRVPENKTGARLDRWLAESLPDLSRSRLKQLIEAGLVSRVGGGPPVAASQKVRSGENFAIVIPAPVPATPEGQDIPLGVVYEDDDLIVIDKPAGLVVHPAAGHADGTLVNALLAHCQGTLSGIGGVSRPGIVHRLDKDTSGLMVAAKNDLAHQGLARQFHDHDLERAYYALIWGVPRPTEGEISGNIGRSPANRKKMAVLQRGGKPALTRYRVLKTSGTSASLVRCDLETGRTHQIRVHMAGLGHPVLGDPLYGGGGRGRIRGLTPVAREAVSALDAQALHAFLIGFTHPRTGEFMRFETKVPSYFNVLLRTLDRN